MEEKSIFVPITSIEAITNAQAPYKTTEFASENPANANSSRTKNVPIIANESDFFKDFITVFILIKNI